MWVFLCLLLLMLFDLVMFMFMLFFFNFFPPVGLMFMLFDSGFDVIAGFIS